MKKHIFAKFTKHFVFNRSETDRFVQESPRGPGGEREG
jgi:hypothetical protein